MKSFLAFYRLSVPAIRSMAAAPSTVEVRRRILDDPQSARNNNNCPTLVELAAKLNIDMASLSDEEWTSIREKISSSLIYTLSETNRGTLQRFFNNDTGVPALD
ncbi:hypothetical protein ColLi_12135 [Colletotrichum liriopes]|uniref:Uncharacterized protein n=1 Tax=Colletotrichum liriopes TaxID=708192 RepID=A0AA37GZS3_9PEZI|nr:hypothetical protein ColLi_12135 [Colletotrichum liriopes]